MIQALYFVKIFNLLVFVAVVETIVRMRSVIRILVIPINKRIASAQVNTKKCNTISIHYNKKN